MQAAGCSSIVHVAHDVAWAPPASPAAAQPRRARQVPPHEKRIRNHKVSDDAAQHCEALQRGCGGEQRDERCMGVGIDGGVGGGAGQGAAPGTKEHMLAILAIVRSPMMPPTNRLARAGVCVRLLTRLSCGGSRWSRAPTMTTRLRRMEGRGEGLRCRSGPLAVSCMPQLQVHGACMQEGFILQKQHHPRAGEI